MPKFVIERDLPGDFVGVPVSAINAVTSVIDPTTGE